jgi:hypothetical protein
MASVELILFLPFYSLFVSALFVIAAIGLNANESEMKNRAAAWRFRSEPWLANQKEPLQSRPNDEDVRIMGGRFRIRPHLAVYEQRIQPGIRSGIGIKGPQAEAVHQLVTGVWDFRELPFPEQSEHPRLTAMDKIRFFVPSFGRAAFQGLMIR